MAFCGLGSDRFFVDLYAQSRSLGDVYEAVVKGEDIRIVQITGQVVRLIVVNALTLLLNKGVLADQIPGDCGLVYST